MTQVVTSEDASRNEVSVLTRSLATKKQATNNGTIFEDRQSDQGSRYRK